MHFYQQTLVTMVTIVHKHSNISKINSIEFRLHCIQYLNDYSTFLQKYECILH